MPKAAAFRRQGPARFEDRRDVFSSISSKKPTDSFFVAELQDSFDNESFVAGDVQLFGIDIPEKAPYFAGNHAFIITQIESAHSPYLADIIAVRHCFSQGHVIDPGSLILNKNWKRVALPEHLPYHLGIAGDKEGRIVVFENGYAWKTHDVSFRLYAPDGKLLSTYKIDPGEFEPARPPRFRNGYAYGWLTKKDGDGTFVFGRWKTGL